ncbi:MAG: hypothetical protein M3198_09885 [Actinomycetota bacterium]|nr:hypothetical protein [Actinomycetota bacterium]
MLVLVTVGLGALVARLNARIEQLETRAAGVYAVMAAEDARSVGLSGGTDRARGS